MAQTSALPLIDNKQAVPGEFNKIASRYDFATGMSQGYQEDLDRSARALLLQGDEHVLDLCCGTGKSTSAVWRNLPSGRITGVDNSAGMLEAAHRKFADEVKQGRMEFHLQDAMHLDFPENHFDAVFMAYGLRNMPDYGKALEGIHRILKPGGRLVIHDYSLSDNRWTRAYWFVLGYFFIVPFCTVVTGSSGIFTYLVKSVMNFLTHRQAENLLAEKGFTGVQSLPHPSWRKPILRTFVGIKK